MKFSRYHLEEKNFVLTKVFGEVNDKNLMKHITTLNKETVGYAALRKLSDCRGITNLESLTVSGIIHSSQYLDNRPDHMTAILVSDSPLLYGMARAFQMFSEEKRKDIQIFKNINEALSWLAVDEQEQKVFHDFINDVSL